MTIKEALKNIDIVISGVRMTRDEHVALQQSIDLVKERINKSYQLKSESEKNKNG